MEKKTIYYVLGFILVYLLLIGYKQYKIKQIIKDFKPEISIEAYERLRCCDNTDKVKFGKFKNNDLYLFRYKDNKDIMFESYIWKENQVKQELH